MNPIVNIQQQQKRKKKKKENKSAPIKIATQTWHHLYFAITEISCDEPDPHVCQLCVINKPTTN